jgi:tetratricopeptide (TPR) repeat protein
VRKGIRLAITILLVLLYLTSNRAARADKWEEGFFKANQAYKIGDFQVAIDEYLRLIRSGLGGGQIYYNLGNAYFRAGQLGRAILEYERAQLLIPRDPDLNFNLSHARDQILDAIEEPRGFVESAFFWLKSFNLGELFWSFAILNLLLWGILIIRLFHKSEWLYYMLLLILSSWFVSGLSFGLKYYWISSNDRAVILQKEVDILAGPEEDDTVLFKLHEGTVVYQERSEDGWSLVRLPDRKRGWVKSGATGLISGDSPATLTSPHPTGTQRLPVK